MTFSSSVYFNIQSFLTNTDIPILIKRIKGRALYAIQILT